MWIEHMCFLSCICVGCTGIYLIVYGLQTLLPDNHESSITFRNNELFEEFIFQHKAKPIFIVLGYITFFIPLIGCWAIILNRTRVLMIYILCLLLEIMGMTIIMSDFLSIHIPTQNEDQVFIDETEVLKMYYDNFYTVDIARGTINQIQTTLSCCGIGSYHEFINKSGVPLSCCNNDDLQECDEASAFSKGCREVILPLIAKECGETNNLFFILATVQLASFAFTAIFMPYK